MTVQKPRPTTTDAGIPVASDEHSLSVGPDGPLLLQDHYLIEQMANFNRERIPERQPHAKGGGAFGTFQVTQDMSAFTRAAVFQPGTETDVIIRFSTVAGERGSPDTWRDPRGFAVKFYTSEGNLDIVGNNTPVFFIRDPLKFQHFIRSQKRRADNNLRDHDMQWDFWTLSPESAHQVTWLMGDRGIPRTWRNMNGYSSHTYMWINAAGERFWVKYHFKTDQGIEFFTQDEGDQMASVDTDYHQRDLFEHIAAGDFPSWTLKMQIMPFEEAKTYRFNPFDLTKVWPHGDYPLHEVGRLTLNRNITDFHTEMEQAAFEPNNIVAGTGLSPDKMLLARGFSYADAHRARLGVNYKQIPVNSAKVPVHSYSKDGAMRVQNVTDPVYAPNSYSGPVAQPELTDDGGHWYSDGEMVRAAYTSRPEDDDWGQAGTMVRDVLDDAARQRLVDNVVGHLLDGVSEPVLVRAFEYWRNVDKDLGTQIEAGVRAKQDETDPKAAQQANPARSSAQAKA
ncbi:MULTISPECIES: catalase [unclassified Parafrankia]|uniref:catalase n=1 Tax=Parafrankia TaxID=2994362 RepID=UPI000DA450FF|nr:MULTISPECIES: catalase [unclassified Parafrankia]TCJ34935.1 catalase [Parafrankia sp. BMG5.11]CAI7975909.1 Catalase [Frankia sp. Hr75.2]SQE00407.1 Catalase [Parafrankia sp. Ea1.12]